MPSKCLTYKTIAMPSRLKLVLPGNKEATAQAKDISFVTWTHVVLLWAKSAAPKIRRCCLKKTLPYNIEVLKTASILPSRSRQKDKFVFAEFVGVVLSIISICKVQYSQDNSQRSFSLTSELFIWTRVIIYWHIEWVSWLPDNTLPEGTVLYVPSL